MFDDFIFSCMDTFGHKGHNMVLNLTRVKGLMGKTS